MGYGQDLATAARRHLRAGEELFLKEGDGSQPACKAVAGYLFGLTGELAIKEIMRDSGMHLPPGEGRRGNPFYAHFPEIKSLLKDTIRGRRAAELRAFAENPSLFSHWDTDMRYAPTNDIQGKWIEGWRQSAKDLVDRMEAL